MGIRVHPLRARILVTASVVLLAATAYMYVTYGSTVYFVAFHKPLHVGLFTSKKYVAPALPRFQVTSKIASKSLLQSGTQTISVTLRSEQTVSGYVEVWISSPQDIVTNTPGQTYSKLGVNNDAGGEKIVYENDTSGNPTRFVKGKSMAFTYSYTLKPELPPGAYEVSDIITSADTFIDYYVNNNFAEFTVQ